MGAAATGASNVADANLNVVPFIDLLICLICFLVVSAVWTSLSRIDVDQALPKSSPNAAKTPPNQPPTIQVAITDAGFSVNVHKGPEALRVPKTVASLGTMRRCVDGSSKPDCKTEQVQRYDHEGLRTELGRLVAMEDVGTKAKVMVAAGDDVPYQHLIATLDSVLHSCAGEGAAERCLHNPAVGDLNLIRGRAAAP
ncbi:MAG: biopolymer transporter ExbD [Myxococcales bacterium]|nr:biopolymer transporter ExbD [Myxococcales bacterium]